MSTELKKLKHGMYLDAKFVMDNALPSLRVSLRDLVPCKLQEDLNRILFFFEDDLVEADISEKLEGIDEKS